MKKLTFIKVFIFLTFSLFARDITIAVMDFDLDIPLEGAVIRLWDGSEHICNEEGIVVIFAPDRQVVIQAAYPGYETGRIVIPVTGDSFVIRLRLYGIMQGRELVIEAPKPGSSETRTGRSIAVGEREIAQTGEIGIIEDVMNTIRLLPGVTYTGITGSFPSIRGGYPGDMMASLDGFYINNPYHWGGAFSIFDPRMVQSAQLSHGVFSARYGHTISGLLEITSKNPSSTDTMFEIGASTSTANFSLSFPLSGNGGILFMGRITFYDPVIALAKQLSKAVPRIEIVNSITTAPYIRAFALSGNYRFTDNLELTAFGFFGMDGVGAKYENISDTPSLNSKSNLDGDFTNLQGFITSSLLWNPRADMLLKFTAGTGFEDMMIDGKMSYNIYNKEFSQAPWYFILTNPPPIGAGIQIDDPYSFYDEIMIDQSDLLFNAQSRIDFDWEIQERILFSAGVQEMFNIYKSVGVQGVSNEEWFSDLSADDQEEIKNIFTNPLHPDILDMLRVSMPVSYSPDSHNYLFTTSAFILGEYTSGSSLFKAELGLRVDHFYITGKGFSAGSTPSLNPRLNLDFNILKNKGFLESLDLSIGTGLFSSVNSSVFAAEAKYNINTIKPNRSWTSVLGVRLEFPRSLSLNIEGYYKMIFDRTYVPIGMGLDDIDIKPHFNGKGRVWGIDVMLQKVKSRYWDGWLAYSYSWAQYRDPAGSIGGMGLSGGNFGSGWYFPYYHRFHNLNLILNYKPVPTINIYLRFGLASGIPLLRLIGNGPRSYPVLIYDKDDPQLRPAGNSYFIEKYYWPSVLDNKNRTTPSLPMDIKLSIYGSSISGKAKYEVYVAVENVLALFYTSQGNTSFNQYTGQIDTGSLSASYDMPIPIPSFGVKFSY